MELPPYLDAICRAGILSPDDERDLVGRLTRAAPQSEQPWHARRRRLDARDAAIVAAVAAYPQETVTARARALARDLDRCLAGGPVTDPVAVAQIADLNGPGKPLLFAGVGEAQVHQGPDVAIQPIDAVGIGINGRPNRLTAVGTCRFTNPYRPPGQIACSAETDLGHFAAEFRSDGIPPSLKTIP